MNAKPNGQKSGPVVQSILDYSAVAVVNSFGTQIPVVQGIEGFPEPKYTVCKSAIMGLVGKDVSDDLIKNAMLDFSGVCKQRG